MLRRSGYRHKLTCNRHVFRAKDRKSTQKHAKKQLKKLTIVNYLFQEYNQKPMLMQLSRLIIFDMFKGAL